MYFKKRIVYNVYQTLVAVHIKENKTDHSFILFISTDVNIL